MVHAVYNNAHIPLVILGVSAQGKNTRTEKCSLIEIVRFTNMPQVHRTGVAGVAEHVRVSRLFA